MDANAFGTLEIAGYALAAVCAIAAPLLLSYVPFHPLSPQWYNYRL